jgi:hypothetical protein
MLTYSDFNTIPPLVQEIALTLEMQENGNYHGPCIVVQTGLAFVYCERCKGLVQPHELDCHRVGEAGEKRECKPTDMASKDLWGQPQLLGHIPMLYSEEIRELHAVRPWSEYDRPTSIEPSWYR